MKKRDVEQYPVGSPERVTADFLRRASLGKRPALSFADEHNPMEAARLATTVLYCGNPGFIPLLLGDMKGLNRFIRARHLAGYRFRRRLPEFIILGRFWTDTCGNFGRIQQTDIPEEVIVQLPSLMTREDYSRVAKRCRAQADKDPEHTYWSVPIESSVPPAGLLCPVCGNAWNLSNCHDTVVTHRTESIPLSDFVGWRLG